MLVFCLHLTYNSLLSYIPVPFSWCSALDKPTSSGECCFQQCRGQAGTSPGLLAAWAVSGLWVAKHVRLLGALSLAPAVSLSRQPLKTLGWCLFALCIMKPDSDKNLGVSRHILHVHTDERGRWKRRKAPRGGKLKSGCNKVMFCTATLVKKPCLAFRSSSALSLFRETLSGIAVKFPALLKIHKT